MNELLGGAAREAPLMREPAALKNTTVRNTSSSAGPTLYPEPTQRYAAEDGPVMIAPNSQADVRAERGELQEAD